MFNMAEIEGGKIFIFLSYMFRKPGIATAVTLSAVLLKETTSDSNNL